MCFVYGVIDYPIVLRLNLQLLAIFIQIKTQQPPLSHNSRPKSRKLKYINVKKIIKDAIIKTRFQVKRIHI